MSVIKAIEGDNLVPEELGERHKEVLRHMLGIKADGDVPHRNYFVAGEGHTDMPVLNEMLVSDYVAVRDNPGGSGHLFCATDKGRDAVVHGVMPAGTIFQGNYRFTPLEPGKYEAHLLVNGIACSGRMGVLTGRPGNWEAEWVDGSRVGTFGTLHDGAKALKNYIYRV